MNPLAHIERPVSIAKALGTGTERIRKNLATFNLQQVVEATRIPSMHLESFIEHGDELSDDQLDRVTGFMKGEYALSGTGEKWVRTKKGAVVIEKLPLGCTDLPVGEAHPNPLGTRAPVAVEQSDVPVIVQKRGTRNMLRREQPEPEAVFGTRK